MIIGLSGKKQHGKSTLANFLIENYGFREVFWAMPLKEIIGKQLFGFTNAQIYGDDIKIREKIDPMWGMSPRQILQIIGTECFRKQICDDFWVKLGIKRIQEINETDPTANIVISDCRFLNEVEAIKKLGGKAIRVIKLDAMDTDTHASETALDNYKDFDYTINAYHGQVFKLKCDISTYMKELEIDATV